MESIPAIAVTRKSGSETFEAAGRPLPISLLDFWQWSSSDLVGNALRGVLAEYIVASAVGSNGGTRTEWDAIDIVTPAGIKIEVKSGAYLQSWAQERLSAIRFDIRPTWGWDASTDTHSTQKERQADVYVFCVLAHKDRETINPLNLDQWSFYAIATAALNEAVGSQKTIGLSSLLKLEPIEASYREIETAIERSLAIG